MLTKTDIKNLKELFVTKEEFSRVTQDILELIYAVRKELKDDILTFKDEILTEIVKLREDFAVLTDYRDMIENHEVRIIKLEKRKVH